MVGRPFLTAVAVGTGTMVALGGSTIVVSGVVEGTNRRHALSAMGAFTEKVHAMPFIVAGSQDEMSAVDGHANRFRFRLSLAWRTK